jgi:branched-subunit amino acid transport protein
MWAGILVGSLGCFGLKVAGMSVPPRVLAAARVQRVASLLPVALLAALIGVQTLTERKELVVDARLVAVLVAALAVWRRAPFLVVVALAAATAALLRRLGWT